MHTVANAIQQSLTAVDLLTGNVTCKAQALACQQVAQGLLSWAISAKAPGYVVAALAALAAQHGTGTLAGQAQRRVAQWCACAYTMAAEEAVDEAMHAVGQWQASLPPRYLRTAALPVWAVHLKGDVCA